MCAPMSLCDNDESRGLRHMRRSDAAPQTDNHKKTALPNPAAAKT